MFKVVITGNIGTGKSTVMKALQKSLGDISAVFTSADDIVTALYDNPEVLMELNQAFGVVTKKEVGALIFANDVNQYYLDQLNAIFAPYIVQMLIDKATSNFNEVIEVPYFFKMMLSSEPEFKVMKIIREMYQVVAVAAADEDERFRRIVERSKETHPHYTEDMIRGIMDAQIPDKLGCALADIAIFNSYNEAALKPVIKEYANHHLILAKAAFSTRVYIDHDVPAHHNTINRNILRCVDYAYAEEHRHYHNIDHINGMLCALEQSDYEHKRHPSLLLAILFHDYVYEPGGDQNEAKSFLAMMDLLEMFQPEFDEEVPNIIELANLLIIETVTHSVTPISNTYLGSMSKLFGFDCIEMGRVLCDLDLWGFQGDYWSVVTTNDCHIRMEFADISDNEWHLGRSEFLLTMLDRKQIYTSKTFATEDANRRAIDNITQLYDYHKKKYLEGDSTK